MHSLTPAALIVLQRQHNVIAVRQLTEAGVTRSQREALLDAGVFEHVGHSVLRVVGMQVTRDSRLIELCLQHPAGMITGPTAGAVRQLRRMPRTAPIHFSLPHNARADVPPYVQLRRTRRLPDDHRLPLANGMVVPSWPRLAFDLAADLSDRSLASVIEQMLHERHCSEEDLAAIARELCAPARPGSKRFARVLVRRQGRLPSESDPELEVLNGLLERGVPVVPQVQLLELPNGGHVRIDLAVPAVRWAVEVDVHPTHLHLMGTTHDKRRDRQLHLIGWQVERITAIDLLDRSRCYDELAQLYVARCSALAA